MTNYPHTDALVRHLRACHACIASKAMRTKHNCAIRARLVKLTLEERHPEGELK